MFVLSLTQVVCLIGWMTGFLAREFSPTVERTRFVGCKVLSEINKGSPKRLVEILKITVIFTWEQSHRNSSEVESKIGKEEFWSLWKYRTQLLLLPACHECVTSERNLHWYTVNYKQSSGLKTSTDSPDRWNIHLHNASWCFPTAAPAALPICIWDVSRLPAGPCLSLQIHRSCLPPHLPCCCCVWVGVWPCFGISILFKISLKFQWPHRLWVLTRNRIEVSFNPLSL